MLSSVREKGQGLVEYALILALVVIIVLVILVIMGPAIGNMYSNVVPNI
jgi:pilus assembly protein Flp/PilA